MIYKIHFKFCNSDFVSSSTHAWSTPTTDKQILLLRLNNFRAWPYRIQWFCFGTSWCMHLDSHHLYVIMISRRIGSNFQFTSPRAIMWFECSMTFRFSSFLSYYYNQTNWIEYVNHYKLARVVTKWTRVSDKRSAWLIPYTHCTNSFRHNCRMSNAADECRLVSFFRFWFYVWSCRF